MSFILFHYLFFPCTCVPGFGALSMALRWGTETVTFLRHSGWKFYQLKIPDARMVSEARGSAGILDFIIN